VPFIYHATRGFFLRFNRIPVVVPILLAACFGCAESPTESAVVVSVEILSSSLELEVGSQTTLTARGLDRWGVPVPDRQVAWSTSAPEIGTIDGAGTLSAMAPGSVTVTARVDGVDGQRVFSVAYPDGNELSVSPTSLVLSPGEERAITATFRAADGTPIDNVRVEWASTDTAKVRVRSDGVITAMDVGVALISATVEHWTATMEVRVLIRPESPLHRTTSYAISQANALNILRVDWGRTQDRFVMQTARAVADFDGDGIPDAVVAPGDFLSLTVDRPLRFYRGQVEGSRLTLSDQTGEWVRGSAPALDHGRKLLLADFNGDDRMDVFVCAHGYDAPPFPGATNALLLSQGLSWTSAHQGWMGPKGYHHGCASGDIDSDGDEDILVLDSRTPGSYFLLNDGQGGFTLSREGLPASLLGWASVFTTEIVDLDDDGHLDLVVGGSEPGRAIVVYWGDGSGTFSDARSTAVPPVSGWPNAITYAAEDVSGNGVRELVVTRTKGYFNDADFYQGYHIQVIERSGRAFRDISEAWTSTLNGSAPSVIRRPNGTPTWIEWVWLADFDGDGWIDLVGSDANLGEFWARNLGTSFGPWKRIVPPSADLLEVRIIGWSDINQVESCMANFPQGMSGRARISLRVTEPLTTSGGFHVTNFWNGGSATGFFPSRMFEQTGPLQYAFDRAFCWGSPTLANEVQFQFEGADGVRTNAIRIPVPRPPLP
jgi:hypothetical protein